jgi:hypothetical protein
MSIQPPKRSLQKTAVGLIAALCLIAVMSGKTHAQLIHCGGLGSGPGYKVLLGDFLFVTPALGSDADMRALMDRLQDVLNRRFDTVSYMEGDAGPQVIPCAGRKPRSDDEFANDEVSVLDSDGVVIEVWGRLDGKKQGSKVTSQMASVHYLLVPLRHEPPSPAFRGFYQADYKSDPSNQTLDYQGLFERTKEIDAYVALGVGIKSYRSGKYGRARNSLCESSHLMRQAWGKMPNDPKQRALIDYSDQLASKALQASGAVRVLDQPRACPEG